MLIIAIAIVALGASLAWVLVVLRRHHLVDAASTALQQLAALHRTYEPLTRGQWPIRLQFVESVSSKSKFDRFYLVSFMSRSVLEREQLIESEIGTRWTAVERHNVTSGSLSASLVNSFERVATSV